MPERVLRPRLGSSLGREGHVGNDAELCPACRHAVRAGAAFCTYCGSPLSNRGARRDSNVNHALMDADGRLDRRDVPSAGSISVVSTPSVPGRRDTAQPGVMAGREPYPGGRDHVDHQA
ncbi:zinc ribbon domain-containing protein [Paenarthrobacter sp. S56]|uniref:zinc ribbon domain-containing protein n=1 Tax=Paenarthrobacter sp. S56 TaxID=3138179 RepID=UPI00321BE2DB